MTENVRFHCPKCGKDTEAEVAPTGIFAHPSTPCLLCLDCHALWRLSLHEVEEGGENDG